MSVAALSPISQSRGERAHRRRQRLIVDRYQLAGVARLGGRLGDDDGDGVAGMADDVRGEHWIGHRLARAAVAVGQRGEEGDIADAVARQVGGGVDRQHAGGGCGFARVEAGHPGMGVRRAQHVEIGLARQVDVIGIAAMAGDETVILEASDRLAYSKLSHATALPLVSSYGCVR